MSVLLQFILCFMVIAVAFSAELQAKTKKVVVKGAAGVVSKIGSGWLTMSRFANDDTNCTNTPMWSLAWKVGACHDFSCSSYGLTGTSYMSENILNPFLVSGFTDNVCSTSDGGTTFSQVCPPGENECPAVGILGNSVDTAEVELNTCVSKNWNDMVVNGRNANAPGGEDADGKYTLMLSNSAMIPSGAGVLQTIYMDNTAGGVSCAAKTKDANVNMYYWVPQGGCDLYGPVNTVKLSNSIKWTCDGSAASIGYYGDGGQYCPSSETPTDETDTTGKNFGDCTVGNAATNNYNVGNYYPSGGADNNCLARGLFTVECINHAQGKGKGANGFVAVGAKGTPKTAVETKSLRA